jgi:hypothetical protein
MTTVEETTTIDQDELEAAEGEIDLDKLQTDFAFRGPVNLRLAVEEHAANSKLGVSQFMRKIVAEKVGYALQSNSGRTPMSDEEKAKKAEEAKQKAKDERARVKATLDSLRAKDGVAAGK